MRRWEGRVDSGKAGGWKDVVQAEEDTQAEELSREDEAGESGTEKELCMTEADKCVIKPKVNRRASKCGLPV